MGRREWCRELGREAREEGSIEVWGNETADVGVGPWERSFVREDERERIRVGGGGREVGEM